MPASRSTKPSLNRAPRPTPRRAFVLVVLAVALVALGAFVGAMPAGVVAHLLPPNIRGEDFSGSVWHGAIGKLTVDGREAGAIEWRVHPAALLHLALELDLHWVYRGFGAAATALIDHGAMSLRALHGGGPIEDLQEFGIARGWRGTADLALDQLSTDYARVLSASGNITISGLSAAQLAPDADLGSYVLHLGQDAVDTNGNVTAQISDAGGPFGVRGTIVISPPQRSGTLSGTIQERTNAPPNFRKQLDDLAQLRGRDREGRIPVDLEFNF